MIIDPTIFKAYDIRGVYPNQVNEDVAYALGRAVATLFVRENPGTTLTLAVGGDMRTSTPALKEHLIAGLTESGINVVDVGLVSTPTYYYAVAKFGYHGGVQVSASHNPAQYNGFKVVRKHAEPMSGETGIKELYQIVVDESFVPLATTPGTTTTQAGIADQAAQDYIALAGSPKIKPFKVAADTANAMGSLDYQALFDNLPCTLVPLYFELDGTFPNHEADPLKPENTQALRNAVLAEKADIGIAADGDADRIFLVDDQGETVPSRTLYALLATETLKDYPESVYAKEVRMGRIIDDVFAGTKARLVPTPVGHSLIKKIMVDNGGVLGGEVSGHYYFKLPFGTFEAPMFLIVRFLDYLSQQNKPLSELVAPYKKYANSGELNTKVESRDHIDTVLKAIKFRYDDGVMTAIDGLRVDYPDWWFIVRASNTEPVIRLIVEAKSEELMEQKRDELLALIRA